LSLRILYLAELFFKGEGKIKTCQDKQSLKNYCYQIAVQEIIKEVLQAKSK
jgi:hypothetical protein